jgi:hypothetical protein
MNLCLIVALFYVFNDDKDKDKISLRNELELLQEAFKTMPEDEFLRQSLSLELDYFKIGRVQNLNTWDNIFNMWVDTQRDTALNSNRDKYLK